MKNYLIIGAGQAGRRAAECLRQGDPGAAICVVGQEPHFPYDRPLLSKDALQDACHEGRVFVRDEAFYAHQRIAMRLGVSVIAISRAEKTVTLDDGARLPYDRLLLATGSRVRRLEGEGVHYLRTLDDARSLRQRLTPGTRVAVIGAGFIGLEVAATAVALGCRLTVLDPAERVLKRAMPPSVSQYVSELHARNGVDLRLGTQVKRIVRQGAEILIDTDSESVLADVTVAGIGVEPNMELAAAAGLVVSNGIVVDEYCKTSDPDIFAAGEVTSHYVPTVGRIARVESWQVAEKQPAVAAANMLGGDQKYREIPWLWSDQYDCNIQSLGMFEPTHTLLERGRPSDGVFAVLGLDVNGRIQAAASVNAGKDMAALGRLINVDGLSPELLADPGVPLRSLIRR